MKGTRWIWLAAVVVLLCGLAVAAACVAQNAASSRFDFAPLTARLDSGEIDAGTPFVNVLGLGKPIAEYSRTEAAGEGGDGALGFDVAVYSHGHQVLILYSADGALYGAQHIRGVHGDGPSERWYFCDAELLARYVKLAVEEQPAAK